MLLEQCRHGEGREVGVRALPQKRGVAAVHDRADDRGVGGGSADALLLEHLHQGGFTEPRGRLGLVTEGLHLLRFRSIAHRKGWQEHLLAFQSGIRVVTALHVGAEEPREVDPLAARAEAGLA